MARGYILNTPRRRNDDGASRPVTMVNPRPSLNMGGWREVSPVSPAPVANKSKRRNPSSAATGRIIESKAGKTRKTAVKPKRTATRTATARVVGGKASSRQGALKRNSSGRKPTQKRSQSRNPARKTRKVATAKRRPGYKWRKGYTRSDGTRVKGGWVKNAKRKTMRRNTATGRLVPNAIPRWEVDVHPGTGKKGIQGQKMTRAERDIWTKRGIKRSRIRADRAERAVAHATKQRAPGVGQKAGPGLWNYNVIHPVREVKVGGQKMTDRDKKLFNPDGTTKRGIGPAAVLSAYGLQPGGRAARSAAAARPSTTRAAAPRGKCPAGKVWRKGYTTKKGVTVRGTCVKKIRKGQKRYRVREYIRKSTGKKVASYMRHRPGMGPGAKRKKGKRAKTKAGHIWRKGYRHASGKWVPGTWVKKPKTAKRKAKKRKYTGRRRPGTYWVRQHYKKIPGRKRRKRIEKYKRRYPKRKRAMRRNPPKRPSKRAVWVKPYVRSDGVRVKGHYMTPATKRRKKVTKKKAKRRAAPKRRRRTVRVGSYLRKVAGRKRRIRVPAYTRRRPVKRRRAPARRRAVSRRRAPARKRVNGRRKGKWVTVKGYTRADGVKVKGYRYRLKKGGRSIARKGRIVRNPSNPYKRKKVKVRSYKRKVPGRRYRKTIKGYKRRQWYPHRDAKNRRWTTMASAKRRGLLNKHEKAALAKRMRRNPSMMALLPAKDQLMIVGKKVGIGAVGFGGAVAMGVALNRVQPLTSLFGDWTPVLGNIAAGAGYWALASAMDNDDLKDMRVPVAVGAGLAAVVNIAYQLVARQTIPSNLASWILPASGAVAVAPSETIEPTVNGNMLVNGNGNGNMLVNGNGNGNGNMLVNGNGNNAFVPTGNGTAGFGQIDVYEAALDGFGGIEEELETELSYMSGMGGMGDGVFDTSPDGILDGMTGIGEYLQTPMGATVEEAYAGMGAQVEQAYAGVGEYLETPMGEYLQTPMGAMVEEAYAGTGEYLQTPMGEYLQTPMGAMVEEAYAGTGEYLQTPMGATVEEAYAGMGQVAPIAQLEESIRNRPLMPGLREAVQSVVRKRIAAGQPLDDAFYRGIGQAAAALARKRFQERAALVAGNPQDIATAPWRAPLLRDSAPMYKAPIGDPSMVPGVAEPIAPRGPRGVQQGIFVDEDTDGIF